MSSNKNARTRILFIHEWFTDAQLDWEHQAVHFGPRYFCEYLSLPGHSGSDQVLSIGRDQSVFDAALNDLLQRLDHRSRTFLVARGVSANLALRALAMDPDRIAGVVLIAPVQTVTHRPKLLRFLMWFSFLRGLILSIYDPIIGKGIGSALWRKRSRALPSAFMKRYIRSLLDRESLEIGTDINRVPICFITGDSDPYRSTQLAEDWNPFFRNGRLIRYAHLGHNPHIEEPALINAAIEQFIAAHDVSPLRKGIDSVERFIKKLLGRGAPEN